MGDKLEINNIPPPNVLRETGITDATMADFVLQRFGLMFSILHAKKDHYACCVCYLMVLIIVQSINSKNHLSDALKCCYRHKSVP